MTIRPASLADLARITEIYNEAILTTTATFDTEPKTVEQRLEWFKAHGGRYPLHVAEDGNGRVIGWAALSRYSDRLAYAGTVENSVYVERAAQGAGAGRRLLQSVLENGAREGIHAVLARIAEGNDASLHLHEALGFFRVGTLREVGFKFGKLLDVMVLEKILSSPQS